MRDTAREPRYAQPLPASDGRRGWRLTMGANVVPGGVAFRVWAPEAPSVDVDLGEVSFALARDEHGAWSGLVPDTAAGTRYRYRVGERGAFPDPYSRFQPEGPHGPSEVVDPDAYAWRDAGWRGLRADGLVIYECHAGTHTAEGTFDALAGDMDALHELGVNAIELMPVADVPGTRNWGYDGVNLFAPSRNYGGPEALRRLVDAAHARGIGVILDVVYNHLGPDGNYLAQFTPGILTDRYQTPWGDAVNYDGPGSEIVRRYVLDNARYWLAEYHIDGLRLDATFAIHDRSPKHILAEISEEARRCAGRDVVLIAETHENDRRYVEPVQGGGYGFDAVWCDDFHHAAHTAASHERSGYYADYAGTTEELARVINRGWLFEGERAEHLGAMRGTPSDGLAASNFVYFLQNHDQVGNRAFGRRLSHLIGAAEQKPWSALLLLLPYTPMIFAGEPCVASSRFYYFTDHNEELGRAVTEGRRHEFASFAAFADEERLREIPDPQAIETFLASKLNLHERHEGAGQQMWSLYRELLALRRSDDVLRHGDRSRMTAIAASERLLLVHRWRGREQRLLVLNTGMALDEPPMQAGVPGRLARMRWRCVISTDERRFGGSGDTARLDERMLSLPAHSAVLFAARARLPLLGRAGPLLERMRRSR